MFKVYFLSMVLDDGSIKELDGYSHWFLYLRSVASGLEKPLLAGYCMCHFKNKKIQLT